MSEPRLCPTCAFFDFNPEEPGYSSYTPGSPLRLGCLKFHWDLTDANSLADARKAMHTASTCPDYKLYVEAPNVTP